MRAVCFANLSSLLFVLGCHAERCGETKLSSANNPDSTAYMRVAEVVRVNCGATTPFVTEVRFVSGCDTCRFKNSDPVFAIAHGTPDIKVIWRDKDHLVVSCDKCDARNVTLKTVRKNLTDIEFSF